MKLILQYRFSIVCVIVTILCAIDALAYSENDEDEELINLIFDYSEKGYYNYRNVNMDSAEYYLQKALDLQYSSPNYEINDRVAINHVILAAVYRRIYHNSDALEHLNKAESILNSSDPDNVVFGSIYHNKGNIYRTWSDFYRTKEYYEYALDFYIENGYQDTEYFSFVFSNYINLLFELEEYEIAEEE